VGKRFAQPTVVDKEDFVTLVTIDYSPEIRRHSRDAGTYLMLSVV
jgi:hypothetical protein